MNRGFIAALLILCLFAGAFVLMASFVWLLKLLPNEGPTFFLLYSNIFF